jgi:ureidoglycolate lyase
MKLVRFATNDSPSRPGVMIDDAVIALGDLLPEAPTDLIGVIDRWEEIKGPLTKGIAGRPVSPVRGATLLAPIERPGKILAIGLNYADHIAEAKDAGVKIPTEQVWFCKQPTSVNSPFAGIHKPIISDQLDYEVELVVVIGKKGPSNLGGARPGLRLRLRGRQRRHRSRLAAENPSMDARKIVRYALSLWPEYRHRR